jgi:hypothetical protein
MNLQNIYNELNIKKKEYKKNINKNNIVDNIKKIICELNEKRDKEIIKILKDYENQNSIISINEDIYKSIEYETILISILEIIATRSMKNRHFHCNNQLCMYSLIYMNPLKH